MDEQDGKKAVVAEAVGAAFVAGKSFICTRRLIQRVSLLLFVGVNNIQDKISCTCDVNY